MKTTLAVSWWLTKVVLWVTLAWCILAIGTWALILAALAALTWAAIHYTLPHYRTWKATR